MLGPCPAAAALGEGAVDRYGWNFVPERDLLVVEEVRWGRLRSSRGGRGRRCDTSGGTLAPRRRRAKSARGTATTTPIATSG